jgi:hypothetical protein
MERTFCRSARKAVSCGRTEELEVPERPEVERRREVPDPDTLGSDVEV